MATCPSTISSTGVEPSASSTLRKPSIHTRTRRSTPCCCVTLNVFAGTLPATTSMPTRTRLPARCGPSSKGCRSRRDKGRKGKVWGPCACPRPVGMPANGQNGYLWNRHSRQGQAQGPHIRPTPPLVPTGLVCKNPTHIFLEIPTCLIPSWLVEYKPDQLCYQ